MSEDQKTQLLDLLKIHFGYEAFRYGQEKAMASVLSGQDTLVIMPTGGGKSMIFQLPALIFPGATIVISPLISLMKDQVDSLNQAGIPATLINSSISSDEANNRLAEMKSGNYKILYIAPERFYNADFLNNLKDLKVSLLAVDEAHCISQWGHDFRPSYLRLSQAVELLGRPPVLALTATATPEVRLDIMKQLKMKNPEIIVTGFSRPNLQFGVLKANDAQKLNLILEIVGSLEGQSGIVYTGTRAKADEIVELLSNSDISAVAYHAGMDNDSRQWVQNKFMNGEARVVVATNAFGLGINKKDIRFVLHHDLPGTVEAYYQEAGRAGRDGLTSYCLLLYSPKDRYLREFFIKGDNPSPRLILEVYDYLLDKDNGASLLLTYSQIAESLSEDVPEMAIGTALKILEREGYISRPNEKTGGAWLKLLQEPEKILMSIPKRAAKQFEVLNALLDKFKDKLIEGWRIDLEHVAALLNIKRDSLLRVIKKSADQDLLKYEPPFKGTEIRVLKRVPLDNVELDFAALKAKAQNAYGKLDQMEEYVYHHDCRQDYILKYFGDETAKRCGICDICQNGAKISKHQHGEYLGSVD